jgi:hypothetical protein
MRKFIFSAAAILALALAAPAFAGHATYYKIKGGSLTVSVDAAKTLESKYGIDLGGTVGPLKLKRGGSVYQSSNSMTADLVKSESFKIKYDTRGADGNKGGVTTVKISNMSLTIGKKKSFVIGNVSGSSTVPGVSVKSGEYRIFNIGGGKVKSSSGGYKYKFTSGDITFNSAITNLLNTFGTPKNTNKASAKVDLGSVSVNVK